MSKVVLSPYPTLRSNATSWSKWIALVNDKEFDLDQVADNFDAQSRLNFSITVNVDSSAIENIDISQESVYLVASISCNSTAFTTNQTVHLEKIGDGLQAAVSISIDGTYIAESIILGAQLITRSSTASWLDRRIISSSPSLRVPLDSDQIGFPAVSFSFDEAGLPSAPWRLIIEADDPEASFMHSVRLELNEDFPLIRDYLDGKKVPLVSSQVTASIIRTLVATVSRLTFESGDERTPDQIAFDAPSSITASANRAAKQYLKRSLNWAIVEYRNRPEAFEMALSVGSQIAVVK